jgi:hypothetical protein
VHQNRRRFGQGLVRSDAGQKQSFASVCNRARYDSAVSVGERKTCGYSRLRKGRMLRDLLLTTVGAFAANAPLNILLGISTCDPNL